MNPEPTNKTPNDWFTPGRFALLLGLLVAVTFPAVLSGTQTFVVRDYGLFSYPVAWFHRQSFWRGEIPLWNPFNCCGLPFLAQFNTLALYPLSLIYLLLPMPWALSFFCLVHIYLAGLGMYFLARRWTNSNFAGAIAGVIFAFNGLSLNFIMWPSHLATFAWMPWVIWLAEIGWREGGRKLILAGLVVAMQILGGGPETILFTWLILGSLMLINFFKRPNATDDAINSNQLNAILPLLGGEGRGEDEQSSNFLASRRSRLLLRFTLIGTIGGGLAAAQLIPFIDLATHSQRDNTFISDDWSMPLWGWGNFLLPIFNGTYWHSLIIQPGQYWTTSYYAGVLCLLLAGVALWRERSRRVWLVGCVFIASIILALGDHGLVYAWLRKVFPALAFARYPVKFTILSLWALPVLAAFGWRNFETAAAKSKSQYIIAGFFAVCIVLMLCLSHDKDIFQVVLKNGICRLLFLAASLMALYMFLTRLTLRKYTTLALLLLVWLDLITHMPWQNPTADPSVYDTAMVRSKLNMTPEPAVGESRLMISPSAHQQLYFKVIPDIKEDYLLHRVVFMSSCNLLDGLPKADGMFSLYLKDMDRLLKPGNVPASNLNQVEDLMSVSQTIAPGKIFDWIPRTNYLPMISAGQKPVFMGEAETLHALMHETVNLRNIVYLPKEAAGRDTAKEKTEALITNKQFGSQKITFTVYAKADSMVFISQAYYHHWKAYVDGQPVPLWRANAAFQALQTPSGKHEVKLVYEDPGFLIGAAISITTLLGCAAGWFILRRPTENKLI